MHKTGLHIYAKHDAKPDQVDADLFCRWSNQRDDDECDLEEIEEEGEQKNQYVHEYEETNLPARQRGEQMLDPNVTVHAIKGQRKNARADQNEDHEGRQLRRGLDRGPQQYHIETIWIAVEPALEHSQQYRAA